MWPTRMCTCTNIQIYGFKDPFRLKLSEVCEHLQNITAHPPYTPHDHKLIEPSTRCTLNKYVFDTYVLRTCFFHESQPVRVGYKRGVVRPEVLGHAHTITAAKFKELELHKLNANTQYTIVAMSQTTVSTVFTMGDILATSFFRWTLFLQYCYMYTLCDWASHTIAWTHRHLGCT